MAAKVIRLARVEPAPPPAPLGLTPQTLLRQHVWRGASGRAYAHRVYSLIACPPLPKATYALIRYEQGLRQVLHIGVASSESATLNLAAIRQRGAQLGANEVHVCFADAADADRALAACDLRAGQFGALGAEPASRAIA